MNHLGTDVVGKRKFRAALKDDKDKIVDEFFFSNERNGILRLLSRIQSHGKCVAVLESIGNMWMRIHDLLGGIGIDTKLTNPYKTKIIATEAKIKSDKLDADRILSDLL
jgi:transposase